MENKKQKLCIEQVLASKSAGIIWRFIGTADGLALWFADRAEEVADSLIITWGDPAGHHETREAAILERVKGSHIRFWWKDDPEEGCYIEIAMARSELTNEYVLRITDFASSEDVDTIRELWEADLRRLHQAGGI